MRIDRHILQAIGDTSLVRLHRVVPPGSGAVYVKLEWENPTGSMKDRAAQAMIARAEDDARLGPGSAVVTLMCDSGLKYLSTDVYRE